MDSDFFDLLKRLVEAGVDFVIVGGFAGIVHGCTFVTQDIDICCDFSADNLLKLQDALFDLNPVHRMTPNRQKFRLTKESSGHFKNLYLDNDIGQLDCLGSIDGLGDYHKVKAASVSVEVEDVQLNVLSFDALIKAKKAMNRPRDKEVIAQLEAIKKLKEQRS